jgi:hypothetical protein
VRPEGHHPPLGCSPQPICELGSGRRAGNRKTLVACLMRSGRLSSFEYFVQPKRCDFFSRMGPDGELVRDIGTRALRWTNWGQAQASAVGRTRVGARIMIVAFHRIVCSGSANGYYRLVRIRRPSGRSVRLKLAKCGQPRF